MVNGVDEPWNLRDVSDDVLNLVTVGQGNVFPSPYPVNRSFVRTDRNRTYINKGTLNVPVWHGLNIAIGEIKTFAGALADLPSIGYLLCNGATVNKITYAELYRVIGNTFGPETANTFTIPDLREKFARGTNVADDLGNKGGLDRVALSIPELPSHSHGVVRGAPQNGNDPIVSRVTGQLLPGTTPTTFSANTGGNTAHENKPPFLNLHYIIAI